MIISSLVTIIIIIIIVSSSSSGGGWYISWYKYELIQCVCIYIYTEREREREVVICHMQWRTRADFVEPLRLGVHQRGVQSEGGCSGWG